ncbi:MAG: hypothetical protein WCM76_03270 [Bacteroidota bacterium]
MKANQYTFDDLHKALENLEYSNPHLKRITFAQLEMAVKKTRTRVIYNIDEIIERLKAYIKRHEKNEESMHCREKELCEIIGVRKLALHQWRKRGLIDYHKSGTRIIFYSLREILGDFRDIKAGNITIKVAKSPRSRDED